MATESKKTTNHNTIKKWAEARKGKPAAVKATRSKKETGIIRLSFPTSRSKQALKEISWEEFFNKFDENKLAMVYQEKTEKGNQSRFNKFVNREPAKRQGSTSKNKGAKTNSTQSKASTTAKSSAGSKKTESKTSKVSTSKTSTSKTSTAGKAKATSVKASGATTKTTAKSNRAPLKKSNATTKSKKQTAGKAKKKSSDINLDTSVGKIRKADDIKAGEYSGIPGTNEKGDIGNAGSGATAAGTKGRGTASHGKPGGGMPEK